VLGIYSRFFSKPIDEWNGPGTQAEKFRTYYVPILMHFVGGSVLTMVGPVQLLAVVRKKWAFVHHWLGYIIMVASFVAGIGGCSFILLASCVGGRNMDIAFFGYGLSLIICTFPTWYYAPSRHHPSSPLYLALHREWALRLFTLSWGSFFYRVQYYLVITLNNYFIPTSTEEYLRPLDIFFTWSFYVIPLLLTEIHIRNTRNTGNGTADKNGTTGKSGEERNGKTDKSQLYSKVYLFCLVLMNVLLVVTLVSMFRLEPIIKQQLKERGVSFHQWDLKKEL